MKKLMLLGGSRYLLPAIKAAHELGVYVITCDYLPDNYAHKFADEYHNVSIIDKDAVLELAQRLKIDGIMSYATDPGVVTAAYVAEQMGLPTSPYESVCILQNKGLFRAFLQEHEFNVPKAKSYKQFAELEKDMDEWDFPVIVKPVDSAGSKGVSRVDDREKLKSAFDYAREKSLTDECIVETFIENVGYAMSGDSFSVDGQLVYFCLDSQWFDVSAPNPFAPGANFWPTNAAKSVQLELKREIQRLISLLGMKTTIYNIEARVGKDGKVYIMEVSPRAGGNRLAEVQRLATGQDIIMGAVKGSLGMAVTELSEPQYDGVWGLSVIHSRRNGRFVCLDIAPKVRDKIHEIDLWVSHNEFVRAFTGANESLGTIIWHCANQQEMINILDDLGDLVQVNVE
ncbi:Biotin carboxylase [Selenomonas ruminantium]|uniref:Biotin carboxylase n=1 Tax=Selenomonas ruminantium TaxID=971 RepID=A0A1I3EH31_SELRU|nr:ATP-grasp domain-containing protein [Selenomonas ruminantium]SFH98279.1 Biotin carboxylase [Selenomonas ruminantium]